MANEKNIGWAYITVTTILFLGVMVLPFLLDEEVVEERTVYYFSGVYSIWLGFLVIMASVKPEQSILFKWILKFGGGVIGRSVFALVLMTIGIYYLLIKVYS